MGRERQTKPPSFQPQELARSEALKSQLVGALPERLPLSLLPCGNPGWPALQLSLPAGLLAIKSIESWL